MIRLTALHLVSVLLAAATQAGEVTIEQRPFTVERTFSAGVLPEAGCILLQIEPKSWQEYQIVEVAAHGSKVAKGDVLVRFDAASIDEKIVDTRSSIETGTLNLAQTELDLKSLLETTPHKLDAYRRAAEVAKEEHSYFTKTRRKATEETASQELERRKQLLSNQQEELKQLAKMYDADDLTEETEEIILTRQRDDVAAAEFALRMEMLDYKRTLEVGLPREAVSLANAERDSAIHLLKAEADLPRAISLKKIELETLKTTHQREQETLADLEHDRALFDIKASASGFFYHGPIENGRWTPGEIPKSLVKHGRPAANRPFATLVPATAKLGLVAFVDEAAVRSLKPGLTGIATFSGREDIEIPVKLAALAASPGPDGSYRADLTPTWSADFTPLTGASAQIRFIAYHQPAAITIPMQALTYGAQAWTVEVKRADGKTEARPVKRGRISGDKIEILSGLEVGQVIMSPEK